MATTLKYNNSIIKNIIVNDNVENKQNIEIKKIEFNGNVVWCKPIILTTSLTKYVNNVKIIRTETETDDPSATTGTIKDITNPNNISVTDIDDINFYFGDTIRVKPTFDTSDKIIYRLYTDIIRLTGDTTISLEAKQGVFDPDIISAERGDGFTKINLYNPNNVNCNITIIIYIRLEDGTETDVSSTNFNLNSGENKLVIIYDNARQADVSAVIRIADLELYGYTSSSRINQIKYDRDVYD